MSTSSSSVSGNGRMTVLKRRFSALERSFTPLSLLLAVAMMLNPRMACTSLFRLGDGQGLLRKDGDERILHVRTDTGKAPQCGRSCLPASPSSPGSVPGHPHSAPRREDGHSSSHSGWPLLPFRRYPVLSASNRLIWLPPCAR